MFRPTPSTAAFAAPTAGRRGPVLLQDPEGSQVVLDALQRRELGLPIRGDAVRASRESVRVTTDQYLAGVVGYLNVITVQTTALSNEIAAIQIQGPRMSAAVQLIQAMGGGWHASDLPTTKAVRR